MRDVQCAVLNVSRERKGFQMKEPYQGIPSRALRPFFIRVVMSSAKADCSHSVIDLGASGSRETRCLLASVGLRRWQARALKSNTHDEAEAVGRVLFLTRDAEGDELPLTLLLYLSDSDDELVLDSSDSELDPESEEWRR